MIRGVLGCLWRRWYIAFPGLIVAGLLAANAWFSVPPSYERSGSLFLMPGASSVPENANPFLYLNGLTLAADVIVRAVGAENVAREIEQSYGGVDIGVLRDPSTAGPVILITVNARTDADAAEVLDILLRQTQAELEDVQAAANVAPADQITVQPITIDQNGTVRQRTRLVLTTGVGAVVAILAILLSALVDGLARRRKRNGRDDDAARPVVSPQDVLPSADDLSEAEPVAVLGVANSVGPGAGLSGGLGSEPLLDRGRRNSGRRHRTQSMRLGRIRSRQWSRCSSTRRRRAK